MQNTISLKDAIKLLKNGYVLTSISNDLTYIFVFEKETIEVRTKTYRAKVSLEDFKKLYSDFNFTLIRDEDEPQENLLKDEEYYSSIQKKQ